ncbi:hypothetical protein HDU93_003353 [Gonapodya sp. JEL0774]|nr:hypothetical protein HDU93_003353 [Gonapodya sp. JEL0774]
MSIILEVSSPVTYSVANLFKRLIVIIGCIFLANESLSWTQIVGTTMTLVGLRLYQLAAWDVNRTENPPVNIANQMVKNSHDLGGICKRTWIKRTLISLATVASVALIHPSARVPHLPRFLRHTEGTANQSLLDREIPSCKAPVSIVTACKNRPDTFGRAFASWLRTDLTPRSVVVVDWGSDLPLLSIAERELVQWATEQARQNASYTSDRACMQRMDVTVVRAYNESSEDLKWTLTWAFNLGFRVAEDKRLRLQMKSSETPLAFISEGSPEDVVLKLDCDNALHPRFKAFFPYSNESMHSTWSTDFALPANSYFSGNWRTAQDENERHLNGAFLARSSDVHRVGGFDERIQTYGWDDSDLFERLSGSTDVTELSFNTLHQLKQIDFPRFAIQHIQHVRSDNLGSRHGNVINANAGFETLKNMILINMVPKWNNTAAKCQFTPMNPDLIRRFDSPARTVTLSTITTSPLRCPMALDQEVTRNQYRDVLTTAFHQTFSKFGLAPDVFFDVDSEYPARLLQTLTIATRHKSPISPLEPNPPVVGILTVDVQRGLANRLRTLASAAAVASAVGWHLRVIWVPDNHCKARFRDLFQTGTMDVWDEPVSTTEFEATAEFTEKYSYMDRDGGLRTPIDTESRTDPSQSPLKDHQIHRLRHIYIKAGTYLAHPAGGPDMGRYRFHLLSLEPVDRIRNMISEVQSRFEQPYVGVHMRSLPPENEVADLQSSDYKSETWKKLKEFRSMGSSLEAFASRLPYNGNTTVYVSADNPQLAKDFANRLGSKVIYLVNKGCVDRSVVCLAFLLGNLLNSPMSLSRTNVRSGFGDRYHYRRKTSEPPPENHHRSVGSLSRHLSVSTELHYPRAAEGRNSRPSSPSPPYSTPFHPPPESTIAHNPFREPVASGFLWTSPVPIMPPEVWEHVFSFLTFRALFAIRLVSKKWMALADIGVNAKWRREGWSLIVRLDTFGRKSGMGHLQLIHIDGVRWHFRPSAPFLLNHLPIGTTLRWRCWMVPGLAGASALPDDSSFHVAGMPSSTDLRGGRQVAESDIRTAFNVEGGDDEPASRQGVLWRYPADTSFLFKIRVEKSSEDSRDVFVDGFVCTPGFLFSGSTDVSHFFGLNSTGLPHVSRSSSSGTSSLASISVPSPTNPHRFQQPLYDSALADFVLRTAESTIESLDASLFLSDDAVAVWLARAALGDRDDAALPHVIAHYAWTKELLSVSRDVLGQLMERHRFPTDWGCVAPAQAVASLLEQNYGYRRRLYSSLRRVRFLVDGRSWVGDDTDGNCSKRAECKYPASTISIGRALVADMKRRNDGLLAIKPYLAGELARVVEEIVNKVGSMSA